MITKFKSIANIAVSQNFVWDTTIREDGNDAGPQLLLAEKTRTLDAWKGQPGLRYYIRHETDARKNSNWAIQPAGPA